MILRSPDSGTLTIGVGSQYGFVEYADATGEPPYFVALSDGGKKTEAFYEFDSGGTPTPIPEENCLPIERVVEIAVYFFKNKEIPIDTNWHKE